MDSDNSMIAEKKKYGVKGQRLRQDRFKKGTMNKNI